MPLRKIGGLFFLKEDLQREIQMNLYVVKKLGVSP